MTDVLATAYFNDWLGGSTDRSPRYSPAELEERAGDHIPFMQGYKPGDPLLQSELEPFPVSIEAIEGVGLFDMAAGAGACEIVFAAMNQDDRPNGQTERSLSVGDVVKVEHGDEVGWFSIKNFGVALLKDPPEPDTITELAA